jgi:hypothetical protein
MDGGDRESARCGSVSRRADHKGVHHSGATLPCASVLRSEPQAYFFGEVSERRPWATNAKTARPLLPGAPIPVLVLFCGWDTARAYAGEYPIPLACSVVTIARSEGDRILRNLPENNLRTSGEEIVTRYT